MMTPPATLKKFDDKADVDPTLQDGNLGGQAPRPSRPSDGSVPPPPRPDPQDMMNSHDWRHQRQPPIGARVQQILNWAQDEDVDRRRDFAREAEMAEAWVDEKLRDRDSLNLGPATVAGLRKCKTALMTHRLFQDYHQKRFLPTRVFNPNAMEPFRERLRYDYERPIHLPFTSPAIRAQQYLPLKPKPRGRDWPALLVNQMWRTDEEAGLKFTPTLPASRIDGLVALATDENALWGPVDKNAAKPTRDNNLSFRENWFYEECIAHDNVGYEGWVHPELNSQGRLARRRLWSGDLPQNDAQGFAAERGSRRAGLQAALRQLQNAENQLVCADGRMVTLPAEPLNREGLRKKAGIGSGRPLPLAQLPANQMQKTDGKADPQGFISNMAQFWTWFRGHMEQARGQVIMDQEHSGPENDTCALEDGHRSAGKDPSVLPPRSLWVPYVWRGVKAEKQINQDLLRKMRNLKKLFDREKRIAPRQLLANMESWYQEGLTDGQRPRLNEDRDTRMHNNQRVVRGLDEVELEWIRFLLNHSMSPQMLADLEPRTTLFIAFAERLARIFNDHSDTLFDSQTTSVSIEDLIDHMAKLDGPCKKTKFYPYDVKMWLGRLAAQGRCTYTEDWRTYGRVSRPRLDCHPEDLIVWKERGDREVNFDKYPEDMIYAPRFTDCRTWLEYIAERSAFQLPQLDANVVQYFRCLAYRWGYAVRMLQRDEEKHWHSSGAVPTIREMHDTLDDFRGRFVALTESDWDEDDSPLQDVWRKTLNKGDDEAITQSEALAAIRKGIIDECVKNNNMLYPGRTADYTDPNAARFREPVWDWAQPSVRGKVKKFFSLDRWPLQLQTKDTQQRIASDADVDPEQLWDPILEDPTPWTYYRPKARPYSDEKVKFRPGHRIYPIGDSRRQREVVKNQVMAMVGQCKHPFFSLSLVRIPSPATIFVTNLRNSLHQPWACRPTGLWPRGRLCCRGSRASSAAARSGRDLPTTTATTSRPRPSCRAWTRPSSRAATTRSPAMRRSGRPTRTRRRRWWYPRTRSRRRLWT